MKQINAKITAKDLNVYYGDNHALKGVNLEIKERQVTSLIGPSGCGKSTFLKSLNRL
ncbi:MAG TPA: ATP-binding cassette domain-containing protein, partial [Bacillota bacterium]|nr:ATP-binding cassette domain-containing protein [Bacillota bacterium]